MIQRIIIGVYVYLEHSKEQFKGKKVWFWCDNASVVWWLIKLRAKHKRPDCQVIINRMAEICFEYKIKFWIAHIKGKDNIHADALSRFEPIDLSTAPFPVGTRINVRSQLYRANELAKNTEIHDESLLSWKDT